MALCTLELQHLAPSLFGDCCHRRALQKKGLYMGRQPHKCISLLLSVGFLCICRALPSGTLLCRWLLHKHLWNLMATLEIWPFLDVGESQDLGWVFCTWLYLHKAIFLCALLSGGMVAEIFCYSCKHTHLRFASDLTWQSLPLDPSLKRHLASQAESQLYPNMLLTSSIQCEPLDHIHAVVPMWREIPRQKTKHI